MRTLTVFLLLGSLTSGSGQVRSVKFNDALGVILTIKDKTLRSFCDTRNDPIRNRILYEYGAIYMSRDARLPDGCLQTKEQISTFRSEAGISNNCFSWGGPNSCLQPSAKAALERAIADPAIGNYKNIVRGCNDSGVDCPNGVNSDWAFRSFEQAEFNWKRGENRNGRIIPETLGDSAIIQLTYPRGGFKPFMFSYAIPGGSQHHLGLAIDVLSGGQCNANTDCERALNKHGWYRTIKYDPNHFTYLGFSETQLPTLGLIRKKCGGVWYWLPNQPQYQEYAGWTCTEQ